MITQMISVLSTVNDDITVIKMITVLGTVNHDEAGFGAIIHREGQIGFTNTEIMFVEGTNSRNSICNFLHKHSDFLRTK